MPETHNQELVLDLINQGRLKDAAELLAQAIAGHETSDLWNDWATVKITANDVDEARRGYERALELNPENLRAQFNLSVVLVSQGEVKRGLAMLRSSSQRLGRDEKAAAASLLEQYKDHAIADDQETDSGRKLRLACFYPGSLYCAWSLATGLVDTLERMGHQVVPLPIDTMPNSLSSADRSATLRDRYNYPTSAELRDFDGILLSGPEHMRPELLSLYPDWKDVAVPKVAWMHETVEREDYGRLPIEEIKALAGTTFSPAIQDERFGLTYLPFGVDTQVFKPDWNVPKQHDTAFIGLMYPKRAQFLEELAPHLGEIKLVHGNVQVQDLSGLRIRETAALYADNLRRIKVFVNLPTLCQLAVTKIFEVLACGTFLITPAIADQRNFENLQAFFYNSSRPDQLGERIRYCLEHDDERIAATRQCCDQVHQLHRLELRCAVLLSALGGS